MIYPPITIIMRNYTMDEARLVAQLLENFTDIFAIEVTLNTPDAYEIISTLNQDKKSNLLIGAGTVLTIEEATKAIESNAQFLLGPRSFTPEIIQYAQAKDVLTVPSAMTPTEMQTMLDHGADIVKIFPADVVGTNFFKGVQGPFGKVPLMAVGGVSPHNLLEYFKAGAQYVGIGSSMFEKTDLENLDADRIAKRIQEVANTYEREFKNGQ